MATKDGMTVDGMVMAINRHREKGNLHPVSYKTRPSSTNPSKTTIEVWTNDLVMKSQSWGVIVACLRGMLQSFQDAPVPTVSTAGMMASKRNIEF